MNQLTPQPSTIPAQVPAQQPVVPQQVPIQQPAPQPQPVAGQPYGPVTVGQIHGHPAMEIGEVGAPPAGQPVAQPTHQPEPVHAQPLAPAPSPQAVPMDQVQSMIDQAVARATANMPVPAPQAQSAPAPAQEDQITALADQMFIDPQAFVSGLEQRIMGQVQQAQEQIQSRERIWDKFYGSYPQWSKQQHHNVIQVIAQQHLDELGPMPEDQGIARLAQYVQAHFQGTPAVHQPPMTPPTPQVVGELPNPAYPQMAPQPAAPAPSDAQPRSLSQVIKQRQAARRPT